MPSSSEPPTELFDRPIVIIGAPRSGTTILGRLLQAHPQVVHLEEPRLTWKFGNDSKGDLLRPEDATPRVRAHIRAAFMKHVSSAPGSRLVEKTPSNALRMGFVDRVLPEARFVHIIRDGVNSTLSIHSYWERSARGMGTVVKGRLRQRLKELNLRRVPLYAAEAARRVLPAGASRVVGRPIWGPRIPGIDQLVKELELIEVCALQWRMCVELACDYGRQLPPQRYMECRLEDLDETLLRSILKFCELDESAEIDAFFAEHFDAGQSQRRRNDADAAMIARIRPWIEPTMKWIG